MGHPYAENLVSMVEEFAEIDFSTLPAPKFMGAFRRHLIQLDVPFEVAEEIASRATVELPQNSVTDEQIEKLAYDFARVVIGIERSLKQHGFKNTWPAVTNMSKLISLKLS